MGILKYSKTQFAKSSFRQVAEKIPLPLSLTQLLFLNVIRITNLYLHIFGNSYSCWHLLLLEPYRKCFYLVLSHAGTYAHLSLSLTGQPFKMKKNILWLSFSKTYWLAWFARVSWFFKDKEQLSTYPLVSSHHPIVQTLETLRAHVIKPQILECVTLNGVLNGHDPWPTGLGGLLLLPIEFC